MDYDERNIPFANSPLSPNHHGLPVTRPRSKLILLPANASLDDGLFWSKKPNNLNNIKNLPPLPSNGDLIDAANFGNRQTKIISLFKNPTANTTITTAKPIVIHEETVPPSVDAKASTSKYIGSPLRQRVQSKNNFISNTAKSNNFNGPDHLRRKNESEQVYVCYIQLIQFI